MVVLGLGVGGFTNRYIGFALIVVGALWFGWAHFRGSAPSPPPDATGATILTIPGGTGGDGGADGGGGGGGSLFGDGGDGGRGGGQGGSSVYGRGGRGGDSIREHRPDIHELIALRQGRTSVQAQALLKPYEGMRLEISAPVYSVSTVMSGQATVGFEIDGYSVFMFFDQMTDRLFALNKGDRVTVSGEVGAVENGLYFRNSELLRVEPPVEGEEETS